MKYCEFCLFYLSSAVEQSAVNRSVLSSNLGDRVKIWHHRLTVRTSDFQSGNRSSILRGAINIDAGQSNGC